MRRRTLASSRTARAGRRVRRGEMGPDERDESAGGTGTVCARPAAGAVGGACYTRARSRMSDEGDILARLRAGEPAAIELLMTSYADRVFRLACGVTRNEADAQEIVQDVFLTVVRKHASFEGRAALSSWIYRITMNAALNKRRGKRAELETSLDAELPTFHADGHREGDRSYLLADWSETPEEAVLSGESREVLRRAIDGLPDHYRAVLVLR